MRAPRGCGNCGAPSPPPRPETAASDPRIEFAQRRLDAFTAADPLILKIHPMAACAPDECHWMMRHNPLTPMFYQAPEYWEWMKQLERRPQGSLLALPAADTAFAAIHPRGDFWASKSPPTCISCRCCSTSFPTPTWSGCTAIPVTRCHPCASRIRLSQAVCAAVDYHEIGSTLLDMFVDNMGRSMAAPATIGRQITDIRFDDLVADPIATVRNIYQRFGYP